MRAGLIIGSWILTRVEYFDWPRTRDAAVILGFKLVNPDSIVPYDIVRNRITYAYIIAIIVPEKIRPTVILKYWPNIFFIKPSNVINGTITPNAITTPGRA